MKIIGFSEINGAVQMVLKCDSSMLVNRKPFFIPDWSEDVRVIPCVVLRVSRLGKNIGTKFATRYYDAVAPAFNIYAADVLATGDWVKAWGFDYALPLGSFIDLERNPWQDTIISFDEAIHRACLPVIWLYSEVFPLLGLPTMAICITFSVAIFGTKIRNLIVN